MVSTPVTSAKPRPSVWQTSVIPLIAVVTSVLWVSLCLAYIVQSVGLGGLFHLSPPELGILLLGLCSVPGMIGIALSHRRRLQALDRANRNLSRHFRDFTRFSYAERQEIQDTSSAARRESLSLFEAAQASLAALNQVQAALQQNTQTLIGATSESAQQIAAAGQQMEDRAGAVRQLTGQFQDNSTELQRRTTEAVTAIEAMLARMEASQQRLGEQTVHLDAAADRTVSRLHLSGEAIHVTLASLGDAASVLDSRRDQIQRTADKIVAELQAVDDTVAASADTITSAARQAADHLAENAAVLDSHVHDLQEAGSTLASQVKALSQTGQQHIESLHTVSDAIAQNANSITTKFLDKADDIARASSDLATRLDGSADRINAGLDGIRHNLVETTGSIDRFGEFSDRVARYRVETEDSLSSILARLNDLAARFQGEIGVAGDVERAIEQAGHTIAQTLASIRNQQELISRDFETFGERGQGLAARLEGLRAAAVTGVSDLVAQADRLQRRSEGLTDELKGQSIAFNEAMTRADNIVAMVKNTGLLIDQAVTHAGEGTRQLRAEFDTVGHTIEAQGGVLQHQADQAVEALANAKARMEDTIAQIGAIMGNLDGKASDINFTVSSSVSRISELTHGLERARAEVLGSSDKVTQHIGDATHNLHQSADRLLETAEKVTGASAIALEAGNKLVGVGSVLHDSVLDIRRSAEEATEKLQSSAEGLSQSADRTKEQLGQIAREVRHENEAIAGTLSRISIVETALRNAGAMVDEIVANAEKAAQSAREEMHGVGREIALQAKVMAETSGSNGIILARTRDEMEAVVTHVQDAFGSLNQKASEINFVVSTAVNRLGELSRGLEVAQGTIDATTGVAAEKMSRVASAMHAEFGGVHEIADRALEQLERTLSAIATASANVDSETQIIEQRLTATFCAAEAGGAAFGEKIGEALGRLEGAEQSFADGRARLAGVAEDATIHFLKLTRDLAQGGSELGNNAVITGERIVNASALVESRLQSINQIADQVRSALGNFASDLGAVSEQSDDVIQKLAQRGDIVRDNIVQMARAAEETGETLKSTTASLLGGATEISDTAAKTRTEIARVTTELRREGAAIAETEAESRALAGQVAALLGERAMELAQVARKVAAETITMRDANAKIQRDLFLSAAKTVLDALASLSVDISRVLDSDLPEELRAELVRGDIPAFVRRLARLRDRVATPKLRAKFATDSRFRTHVQAYLSQFEQLVTEASKVEQGAVLSATLISSDIGKIYTFLSAAISTEHDDMQQTA